MRLRFMGGIDTVTGSQHLIECNGSRVLRDCGLFQGPRKEAQEINRNFAFDPTTLHAMELSHAHMDHVGNIPRLVAAGFERPIHATTATVAISEIMLRDSARIQEQDAGYLNQKTNRKGLEPVTPLYTTEDVERTLPLFTGHEYAQAFELAPGVVVETREAGHVLGAALSLYTLREQGRTVRVGYAVDLGRRHLPLIRDPQSLGDVDVLVIESTYGDRLHGDVTHAGEQLREAVARTFQRGGKVLIPAFALERSQELLYHFNTLMSTGALPKRPVYVDSPMAQAITRVFGEKSAYLDEEFRKMERRSGCLMCPDWVRFISSVEESKAVTASNESCIVIAGSGMCEHGRILHHLKQGISNPNTMVLIVGFQAEYTLGRRLVNGDAEVRIFGDLFPRKAEVVVLDAFSAHADRNELLDYVRGSRPKKTFLVHGEKKQRAALAEAIRSEGLGEVHEPVRGDEVQL